MDAKIVSVKVCVSSDFFCLSIPNNSAIFSGFPKGKFKLKGEGNFGLPHLEFDHQTGNIDLGVLNQFVVKAFHDCEHAYLHVQNGDGGTACSIFGTGSPAIDELTATCVHWGSIFSVTRVETGKLIPI